MNKQSMVRALRKLYNGVMGADATDEEVEWCFTRASPRDFNNRR